MMLRARWVIFGLIALVIAQLPATPTAKNEGNRDCFSSCGSIGNISYPFRLKGDPRRCGLRDFELACENNRTILDLFQTKYYVEDISYEWNYTIRLVDASLDKDHCSIPHNSFPISKLKNCPYDLFLLYTEALCFTSCSNPVNSSNYVNFSTCINSSFASGTYFYAVIGDLSLADIHDSCNITLISLVTRDLNLMSNLSISYIHQKLLWGFELSWCSPYLQNCSYNYKLPFTLRFLYFWLRLLYYHSAQVIAFCITTGGFFVGRTLLGILCLIILVYRFRRRHLSMDDTIENFLQSHNNFMPIRYSFSELKQMTKDFKDKIGQGGFGSVFKAKLRSGRLVAVKLLGRSKANGQDFISEVATIGRIHHVNVVKLIGFCAEGSKRALVYDYMPNGSLDKLIFTGADNEIHLSWERMCEIALGVARGIEYLHRGCDMRILHFDIKPHNILLDEEFVPKVSDFGLAKLYSTDESIVSLTAARGTLGYIAPELFYKNIGSVSHKADVYSFGMLLMEMVGKRKNVNAFAEHSSQIYFPSWIYDHINQGEDIELGSDATEEVKRLVRKMTIVAIQCIQMKPVDRPSMSEVLDTLEGKAEVLQIPPRPCFHPQENPIEDEQTVSFLSSYSSSSSS